MITFTILYSNACNFWEHLRSELQELIKEKNLDANIEEVLVETDEQASKHRFFGSPQLLINGKDIDPMAEQMTTFQAGGCRFVVWQEKMYEYPPREMILDAIEKPTASK